MPTYEYRCKACDTEFELFQRVTDPAPVACPKCSQGPVQKVFRSVGIIFKGSGFHVNDYRKDAPKKEGEPADTSKPAGGETTDAASKSDSTPAADSTKTESAAKESPAASSSSAAGADAKPTAASNS